MNEEYRAWSTEEETPQDMEAEASPGPDDDDNVFLEEASASDGVDRAVSSTSQHSADGGAMALMVGEHLRIIRRISTASEAEEDRASGGSGQGRRASIPSSVQF